jgi:hypothetical protein
MMSIILGMIQTAEANQTQLQEAPDEQSEQLAHAINAVGLAGQLGVNLLVDAYRRAGICLPTAPYAWRPKYSDWGGVELTHLNRGGMGSLISTNRRPCCCGRGTKPRR